MNKVIQHLSFGVGAAFLLTQCAPGRTASKATPSLTVPQYTAAALPPGQSAIFFAYGKDRDGDGDLQDSEVEGCGALLRDDQTGDMLWLHVDNQEGLTDITGTAFTQDGIENVIVGGKETFEEGRNYLHNLVRNASGHMAPVIHSYYPSIVSTTDVGRPFVIQ